MASGAAGTEPPPENLSGMRRLLVLALITLLWAGFIPSSGAAGSPAPTQQDALLFAGGGTPLTNGVFFPGAALCDSSGCTGAPPLQVQKGANVMFTNLDTAAVTNAHKIRSFKMKRGRPYFESDLVYGPGSTVMITSYVKPGIYVYFCTIHSAMYGQIEVVKP